MPNDSSIEFQTLCWYGQDVKQHDESADVRDSRFPKQQLNRAYTIDVYGKTEDGRSVCMHVPFQPYFFVEVPDSMTDRAVTIRLFQTLQYMLKLKGFSNEPVRHRIVHRKKFYGFFDNGPDSRFCALIFKTVAARKYAASMLRKDYELYESSVDPILRLMHQRDLEPAGWARVTNYAAPARATSRCDVEGYVLHLSNIERIDRTMTIAPLVVASFGIQCVSTNGGSPNPRADGSPIISIATCFQRHGESAAFKRSIVCLRNTAPVDGVELSSYEDERDLLLAWGQSLCAEKADVLIGYNTWGFDMEYVWERARLFGCTDFFTATGTRTDATTALSYGNHDSRVTFQTPGILQIELMQLIKEEHKLDSYKLDHVAGHFLDKHPSKPDLAIPGTFRLFQGSARDRSVIAEKCVRDTEVPLKLLSKLAILPKMVELANTAHVPIEYLLLRGHQINGIPSQVLKKTRERGYLCP